MTDPDYGERRRYELYYDWRAKPRYRPHWRAALAGLLCWVALGIAVYVLVRGL